MTKNRKKRTDRELIRIALHYADEHLASLLDAHSGAGESYTQHVERWTNLRADLDSLYERRFGAKAPDPFEGCGLVRLEDIR